MTTLSEALPGQHHTRTGMPSQLNQYGITVRPARTSVITLAAELPAAVLADALGLHPNTVVRWARLANSAWASYLAAGEFPATEQTPP